jgi:hypothetical protein
MSLNFGLTHCHDTGSLFLSKAMAYCSFGRPNSDFGAEAIYQTNKKCEFAHARTNSTVSSLNAFGWRQKLSNFNKKSMKVSRLCLEAHFTPVHFFVIEGKTFNPELLFQDI